MSEEKVYFCRVCEEKESPKFYDRRYNICKSCYSKRVTSNKEKSKTEIEDFKKRFEDLEKVVLELKGEMEELKSKNEIMK
jgi:hypothetical protein